MIPRPMKTILRTLLFSALILLLAACKPTPKSGYVAVPTVSPNALSGVYDLSPTHPTSKLYYEELGQGEPLILLHAQSLDCRMWDPVFYDLARKYRVIRYDLRGYGKSDVPETGFGYLMADDLAAFMDGLGIRKAHFAGVCIGGMTLADFVALHPDRVLSATISSGAITGFPDRTTVSKKILKIYNDTIFKIKRKEVEKNMKTGVDSLKKEWKRAMRSISGKHFRKIHKPLFQMIDEWTAWQWTHPETDAFMGDQADSLLTKQKHHPRILFIIGQHDSKSSKRSMQRMAAICKNARIEMINDAGHFPVMETPDDYLERLERFLGQH